jgi:hypothetical protein
MKKIIFYCTKTTGLVIFLVLSLIFNSCSKKNYISTIAAIDDVKNESIKTKDADTYIPPLTIIIPDDKAKTNKEGELYYDNENGYRYWRNSDGKYYLDAKYEKGETPKKKFVKKRNGKSGKKMVKETEKEEFVTK